jgi:hypothetical protein
MRIATVREFRDRATAMFRGKEPVLVMRRGHLAGIFFPQPAHSMPVDLKREMYGVLALEVARQFKKAGVTEQGLVEDFRAWRRAKRASRGRR